MTRYTGTVKSMDTPRKFAYIVGLFLLVTLLGGCRGRTPSAPGTPGTPVSTPGEVSATPSPTLFQNGPVPIPTPVPEETSWKQTPLMVRRFYLATRHNRSLLFIEAMLPTPCHEARAQVQAQPGRIQVDVFAVVPPGQEVCVQVLSYLSGYVDLTPWLKADPDAEVWLGNQRVPVQEGLAPPITPPTTPPATLPQPPSGGGPMSPSIPTPGPKESSWQQGPFYLQEARVEIRGNAWRLVVSGSSPTPCHQVRHRVTLEGARLLVEIFTLRDPDVMCIQMLQPFSGEVDLTPWARQHPGAEVWVNGQRVGTLGPEEE